MDPARGRANIRRNVFEKSDDVMVRPLFNFGDLIDLELPFLANDRGVFFRNQTQPRHRFAGDGFDFEPDLKFAFVRPDGAHPRSGITVNHPGNIKALPKAGKRLLQKENAPAAEPPERLKITFPKLADLSAQKPAVIFDFHLTAAEQIGHGGDGFAPAFGAGTNGQN
jgi:hypothetical protein